MSNEVHENMASIFEYISQDSLKYANETVQKLYSCIYNLEDSPYLGRYVPELQDKSYLEILYKSYRIVYSISEKEETIYIHFIIHGKRDLKSHYNSYISKK